MLRRFIAGLALCVLAACARTPEPVRFHAEGMPASLADWNVVYVADGRLRLNARVVPYDLATPLFTDYAHKLRTVWMPAGTRPPPIRNPQCISLNVRIRGRTPCCFENFGEAPAISTSI